MIDHVITLAGVYTLHDRLHNIIEENTHRGNLRIPRQELRRMLLEKLPQETVIWNKQLLSYTEDAKSGIVEVRFSDGDIVNCVRLDLY